MTPDELIGRAYRLGSNFDRHGTGDCLSLARAVLSSYGITTPAPKRQWYRRLRAGDTEVFVEELERWGVQVTEPRIGVVALCLTDAGYGLATYWEEGWISYVSQEVSWSPIDALQVAALYCQQKPSCVMPSV